MDISIHALREEGDRTPFFMVPVSNNFYPRPPRGGRPDISRAGFMAWVFLSTPSARRATTAPRPVR